MDPILVTGGTGTLGRHVVRRLIDAGRDVRVLTRRTRDEQRRLRFVKGDLLSGAGIEMAVDGVATIVHCAGSSSGDEVATKHLVDAASRAGRPHVVYISVVGAERVPVVGRIDRTLFGYFDMKRKAEEVVAGSGLPWTMLRATQFHDLVVLVLEKLVRLPIVPVPSGVAFQPVDADEVAARLVELSLAQPSGLAPDVGGPRVIPAATLVRAYLRATRRRRPVLPVRLPGSAARAVRAGANLAPEQTVGRRTWEEFLADRLTTAPRAGSAATARPGAAHGPRSPRTA
jgi:uncharacterized protein YbjT (DUF2867 family)